MEITAAVFLSLSARATEGEGSILESLPTQLARPASQLLEAIQNISRKTEGEKMKKKTKKNFWIVSLSRTCSRILSARGFPHRRPYAPYIRGIPRQISEWVVVKLNPSWNWPMLFIINKQNSLRNFKRNGRSNKKKNCFMRLFVLQNVWKNLQR